jgi:GNAT superfamily N-acetyltransferase
MVITIDHSTYIEQITINDLDKLTVFLNTAGTSLNNFRYFNKRDIYVIQNHLITYLLYHHGDPIGYGHLDLEDNIVWLGIAVIEAKKGMGFGTILMNYLISSANNQNITLLRLSVDINNFAAIQLYKKFGFFEETRITDSVLLMNLVLGK